MQLKNVKLALIQSLNSFRINLQLEPEGQKFESSQPRKTGVQSDSFFIHTNRENYVFFHLVQLVVEISAQQIIFYVTYYVSNG